MYHFRRLNTLADDSLSSLLHHAALTPDQAAALLGRTRRTLRRWERYGIPPGPRHHLYCCCGFLEALSPSAEGFRLVRDTILTPTGRSFVLRELELVGLRCQLLSEYERRLIKAGLF